MQSSIERPRRAGRTAIFTNAQDNMVQPKPPKVIWVQSVLIALAAWMTLAGVGCTPTINDLKNKKKFYDDWPVVGKSDDVPEPYPNPVRLATTWTADTLMQSGRTPTRGFGGRVYFYDEQTRTVPVDGTLIVHAFDDSSIEATQMQAVGLVRADGGDGSAANENAADSPVKRYEFTPEQFTRHFSQTDLGASYSVWIPWDAVGGERKRISLVASFKNADGKLIQGTPATVMLPGIDRTSPEDRAAAQHSQQYRDHLAAMRGGGGRSAINTTTIARRQVNPRNDSNRGFDGRTSNPTSSTRLASGRSRHRSSASRGGFASHGGFELRGTSRTPGGTPMADLNDDPTSSFRTATHRMNVRSNGDATNITSDRSVGTNNAAETPSNRNRRTPVRSATLRNDR